MNDYGVTETDRAVRGLERRLRKIYKEAEADLDRKLDDFLKRYKAKEAIHRKELDDEKITQAQYDAWVRGQVFQGNQWRAKKEQIQSTIHEANKIATKMINEQMVNVFAVNANYMAYSLEHDADANFGFGAYDSATVTNLIKNNPQLLPKWKINKPKDYRWNAKKVVSQITQGIIQGEKLEQIGKRLTDKLCTTNKNKMMTFARTAMTGAQNAGRQFSLTEAKNKSINVQKEWMATLDGRTRDAHRELDGQKVPMDKPFKVNGEEIMFPGDPTAKAYLVYNCRCTMVGDLVDYPSEYKRYDNIDGKPIKNMTYREWESAKNGVVSTVPLKPKFSISDTTKKSITLESASEDWFEYENANAMREYVETGEMPTEYMFGGEIDRETREHLAAEAELMQNIGATTKTKFKTLYRGMVLDEDDARSMFTPGEQYTFNTLSATTSDRGIAKIYMDPENAGGDGVPVILEIQKSDGIYGFDRDGIEVVIPKGSEFRVVKNWMDENGIVHVSLYSKKGKNVREE